MSDVLLTLILAVLVADLFGARELIEWCRIRARDTLRKARAERAHLARKRRLRNGG